MVSPDLNDLTAFMRVADAGDFHAAAQRHGVRPLRLAMRFSDLNWHWRSASSTGQPGASCRPKPADA